MSYQRAPAFADDLEPTGGDLDRRFVVPHDLVDQRLDRPQHASDLQHVNEGVRPGRDDPDLVGARAGGPAVERKAPRAVGDEIQERGVEGAPADRQSRDAMPPVFHHVILVRIWAAAIRIITTSGQTKSPPESA